MNITGPSSKDTLSPYPSEQQPKSGVYNFYEVLDLESSETRKDIYVHHMCGVACLGNPWKSNFSSEPNPGYATAFLISSNLMVCAAHPLCKEGTAELDQKLIRNSWAVFNFRMTDSDQFAPRDYGVECRIEEVIAHTLRYGEDPVDWAVFRIDPRGMHPDIHPLPVNFETETPSGTPVYMMGHYSGLPLKVSTPGKIGAKQTSNMFECQIPSLGRSSGSPIIDTVNGSVVGFSVGRKSRLDADRLVVLNESDEPGNVVCQKISKLSPRIIEMVRMDRLCSSAKIGDLDEVRRLLELGVKIDSTSDDGLQPIHFAAWNSQIDMVNYLLDQGASVSATNDKGMQPLHFVAHSDGVAMAELLIMRGADVNATDNKMRQPIHIAAGDRDKHNPRNTMESSDFRNAELKMLDCLVHHGASLEAANSFGETPLHLASYHGDRALIEFLVEKGAKLNSVSKEGSRPLHCALRKRQAKSAKLLIRKGAAVDVADNEGVRPLHLAFKNNYVEVAQLLVEKGAEIEAATNDGLRPLHFAVKGRSDGGIKLLLDRGVDVLEVWRLFFRGYISDFKHKKEIINLLARKYDIESFKQLISEGIDFNVRDNWGRQPVHYAVGSLKLLMLLLENGARIEVSDSWGLRPLHLAAEDGASDVVEFLLSKGASINAASNTGERPLHLAVKKKGILMLSKFY